MTKTCTNPEPFVLPHKHQTDDFDVVSMTSGSSISTCCSLEQQQQQERRQKRPRRSVQFEEDSNRQVKRRVFEVDSVLNLAEKSDLWMQPCEVVETINSIRNASQSLRQDKNSFGSYVNALAETYCTCCLEEGEETVVSPSKILLLGLARGMEPFALPELGIVRGERRRQGIQSLVQLDLLLRNSSARDVMLGAVAESLSVSAKLFARALGAADATAALIEHMQTPILTVPTVLPHVQTPTPETTLCATLTSVIA